MAELTFYYGVMGCSKTANALMSRWEALQKGWDVWLIKPAIDTRDDEADNNGNLRPMIKSRVGLCAPAKAIKAFEHIIAPAGTKLVICDEAQFLQPWQVDELNSIAKDQGITVLCFGLRTDFKTNFFPGSCRLFEIADRLIELETFCDCGEKAIITAKLKDGKLVVEGDQIELGSDNRYKPMCYKCWKKLQSTQKTS